jgi:hypothetical protein
MTKYQLLRALEPFTDEIEITNTNNIFSPLRVFYGIDNFEDAKIYIGFSKPDNVKVVELKVE